VDDEGYRTLIDAAVDAGVSRFVYLSVSETPYDDRVPAFRAKRVNERRLRRSGMDYTILRSSLFIETWLALIGSSVPIRGTEAALVERPYRFLRLFRRATGQLVERHGVAVLPGSGRTRHSFVAAADVAAFVAACADDPEPPDRVAEIGGPESLSWDEVVDRCERVLGREVRAVHTTPAIYSVLERLLRPVSVPAANVMGLYLIAATTDTAGDASAVEARIGRPPVTVEAFLRRNVASDSTRSHG